MTEIDEIMIKQKKDIENYVPPKHLTILSLIWILLGHLIRHGNMVIHYHICLDPASHNNPMTADVVEIRIGSGYEKRLTIW